MGTKSIQVFDKPMCCSTGICGPQVDPVLPRFAADLDWLKSHGVRVERFNLAQEPLEFAQNAVVRELLTQHGTECLPVVLVDGHVTSQRQFPTREQLAQWTDLTVVEPESPELLTSSNTCCPTGDC
jgi:hypothetical protein